MKVLLLVELSFIQFHKNLDDRLPMPEQTIKCFHLHVFRNPYRFSELRYLLNERQHYQYQLHSRSIYNLTF